VKLAAALLVLGASRAQADPMYTVTNLGQVGVTGPYSLNDSGEVVGNLANGNPFLYQSSGAAAGTFTNLSAAMGANTTLVGINDSGQIIGNEVVGSYFITNPESQQDLTRALLYSGGQVTVIQPFSGTTSTMAFGISNSGMVIGNSGGTGYSPTGGIGYIYQNGQMTNPGYVPAAISHSGLLADYSGNLYQNGQITATLPAGTGAYGQAVNDSGAMVGSFWAPNSQGGATVHAFLYQDGHMVDLGALLGTSSSVALGINSLNQVVGTYTSAPDSNRAFLYQNGTMSDLNTLIPVSAGLSLTQAVAINNNGQILAEGDVTSGVMAGPDVFLLTPTSELQAPEPSTLAFFALAVVGVALRRAWRHG
jgi:probable HAF family extracellular repeat protein